jgi:cobalamin-dependent methionine synthase I
MRRIFQLEQSIPDIRAVLGRLGHNSHKTEAGEWIQRIEHLITKYAHLLSARGVVDTFPVVQKSDDTIVLANGLIFSSKKLALVLKNSQQVTVMAGTLGQPIIDEIQNLLARGEITTAAILDAIASESIDHCMDWMQAILLREHLRFGSRPTMRFSPGYGDWALPIQQDLVRCLQAEEIGLSVHPESYILQPEKSITAVIGWENA